MPSALSLSRLRWGLVLILAAIGCDRSTSITQYEVPKVESIQLPAPEQPGETGAPSEGRPERMLGAIVLQGEQLWFWKLTGPVEAVAAQDAPFRKFIETIRFTAAGAPEWDLPAGWTQQPASGLRFATLKLGGEPPLEITVTVLPAGDVTKSEALLSNLNRWRGQLALAPWKPADVEAETQTVELAGGSEATLVALEGKTKPGGMMPPFAGGAGMQAPFANRPPRTEAPPAAAAASVKAIPAEQWTPGKVGGMRKAAYEYSKDGQRVEITVIDLAREAGDRLANVNRWRGQIGMETVDAAGLKATMRKIEVGGHTGDLVELIGTTGEKGPQAILGVIVDVGEKTWFIKLQGDAPLALAEKAAFEAFTKTVQLPAE